LFSKKKKKKQLGSSLGQFWTEFLKPIVLNTENINWENEDLGYLDKIRYDREFFSEISNSTLLTSTSQLKELEAPSAVLFYTSVFSDDWRELTTYFHIMSDEKAGVPRTGYYDVVHFYFEEKKIFLVPTKLKSKLWNL
jgi:alpha-1,3-mannosyl-glycoprotein beta-1,2-N-acetylglucosaminyltransferase